MTVACQKQREEREQQAAAVAPAGDVPGVDSAQEHRSAGGQAYDSTAEFGGALSDRSSGSSGGLGLGSSCSAGASTAAASILQEHFAHFAAAHYALPPSHGLPGQPQAPAWQRSDAQYRAAAAAATAAVADTKPAVGPSTRSCLAVAGGPLVPTPRSDSARTSTASGGGAPRASCLGCNGPAAQHPASAGLLSSRGSTGSDAVTVEHVIEQRQAAAAGAAADASPARPGCIPQPRRRSSAALAAWASVSVCSSPGGPEALSSQSSTSWQQHALLGAYSHGQPTPAAQPTPSSTFLYKVAALIEQQPSISSEGGSGCGGADCADSAGSSVRGSSSLPLLPAASTHARVATPDRLAQQAPAAGAYIPPALLSALRTVRMSPCLPSSMHGSPPHGKHRQRRRQLAPAVAGSGEPSVGGGSSRSTGSSTTRSGGERRASFGQAGIGLPWMPDAVATASTGVPMPPAHAILPAAARRGRPGAASAGKPSPTSRQSPPSDAVRGPPTATGGRGAAAGSRGRIRGSKQQYLETIEQQAVQSVAELVSNIIHSRGL